MTHTRMHLGILFGGRSQEHEVSLLSAESVLAHLDPAKYQVTQIGIAKSGRWFSGDQVLQKLKDGRESQLTPVTLLPSPDRGTLYACRPAEEGTCLEAIKQLDVVFPLLHGTFGEDGTVQGLLEMCGIPFVGAGVLASAVAMDKALFKNLMRAYGLPILDFLVLERSEIERDTEACALLAERIAPYPLFVKPANLGSSVGITRATNRAELLSGLNLAARFDRRVVVERGIAARELEVSVLGNADVRVSLPGEILPSEDFYTYKAKYQQPSELVIPAQLPPPVVDQIRSIAGQAYRAIDGSGMARVDFLLDKDTGQLYLSEINTIPGFTEHSMYPKLWEASGIAYEQLIDELVRLAMERGTERRRTLFAEEEVQE